MDQKTVDLTHEEFIERATGIFPNVQSKLQTNSDNKMKLFDLLIKGAVSLYFCIFIVLKTIVISKSMLGTAKLQMHSLVSG